MKNTPHEGSAMNYKKGTANEQRGIDETEGQLTKKFKQHKSINFTIRKYMLAF